MPSPCAAVRCPNVRSNAANQVVLVPMTPRLVTVPTSASRRLCKAKPVRAFSPPNRPLWSASRSKRAVNFAAVWRWCGRPANNGRTVNWRMSRPPPERLKKGASNGPPGRNRPGDRSPLRSSGGRGFGFRSRGNGAAPTDPQRPATTITTAWGNLRDAAGVKCRLHDLRHTAATKMAEAGVVVLKLLKNLVGAAGLEPATLCLEGRA